MMTVITEVFGVRGELGDLVISPKLVQEQFDETGIAAITLRFAGKEFHVIFANMTGADFGQYQIEKAYLVTSRDTSMRRLPICGGKVTLEQREVLSLPERGNKITIELM